MAPQCLTYQTTVPLGSLNLARETQLLLPLTSHAHSCTKPLLMPGLLPKAGKCSLHGGYRNLGSSPHPLASPPPLSQQGLLVPYHLHMALYLLLPPRMGRGCV